MTIELYDPSQLSTIIHLHELHNQHHIVATELPEIGYIVWNEKVPVAAGFLRKIEGGFCHIDTLVTNPTCLKEERHEAIELLVDTLLEKAVDMKMKAIVCWTDDRSIVERAGLRGFRVDKKYVMVKQV